MSFDWEDSDEDEIDNEENQLLKKATEYHSKIDRLISKETFNSLAAAAPSSSGTGQKKKTQPKPKEVVEVVQFLQPVTQITTTTKGGSTRYSILYSADGKLREVEVPGDNTFERGSVFEFDALSDLKAAQGQQLEVGLECQYRALDSKIISHGVVARILRILKRVGSVASGIKVVVVNNDDDHCEILPYTRQRFTVQEVRTMAAATRILALKTITGTFF